MPRSIQIYQIYTSKILRLIFFFMLITKFHLIFRIITVEDTLIHRYSVVLLQFSSNNSALQHQSRDWFKGGEREEGRVSSKRRNVIRLNRACTSHGTSGTRVW